MKKIIYTNKSSKPIGPYSQAIFAQNFIFISGQISHEKNINNDILSQTKTILYNINSILESQKMNVSNIVKTTIFIVDLSNITTVNNCYKEFFMKYTNIFPARSCVEVSNLPNRAKIEIEAIAYKNEQ